MSDVRAIAASGSAYVDDLLKSTAWTSTVLYYAFAQSAQAYGSSYGRGETSTFASLNALQKDAVRDALAAWSDVANVHFTEAAPGTAELMFGSSSAPSTAWAYAPSTNSAGGDVWIGKAAFNASPELGNYAWMTVLHEIGHALGLAHPHEASGIGISAADDGVHNALCPCCAGGLKGQLPAVAAASSVQSSTLDAMPYSVMSYRSYVGADLTKGYQNETSSYAQSPMARDIAAIQHIYGANYETRAGGTIYRWNETTGEKFIDGVGQGRPVGNKVFETIWDGGGVDTFDLSNFHQGIQVDLRPGQWTNLQSGQLAKLGATQLAPGNIALAYLHDGDARSLIENVIGGNGNDTITGNAADNILVGGAGDDTLFGMEGRNILVGDNLGSELQLVGITAGTLPASANGAGAAGNDRLIGGAGNDIFVPGNGNDAISGGDGMDTLVIDLAFAALDVTKTGDGYIFTHAGGTIEATGVELLATRDGIFSLVGELEAADTRVQDVALLYQAGLGRETDTAGLQYWLGQIDETGLTAMAQSLIASAEFAQRFGQPASMTAESYVTVLYENVLGRHASEAEAGYWLGELDKGMSQADILMAFAQSDENRARVEEASAPIGEGVDLVAVSHAQWAQSWA